MPIYEFACSTCRTNFDVVRKLQDYKEPAYCPKCTTEGSRVLSKPAVVGDYAGYTCPVSGKWIEGRKAHEENLKRTGCRIFEPGEKEQFLRNKERQETEWETSIEEAVAHEVASLPPEKQQALAREFESNPDIQITRQTAE